MAIFCHFGQSWTVLGSKVSVFGIKHHRNQRQCQSSTLQDLGIFGYYLDVLGSFWQKTLQELEAVPKLNSPCQVRLMTICDKIFNFPTALELCIAFHCSEIASLSDGNSGQAKNLKKEAKLLTRAFQITYFTLILTYRWIRF